tara:strand:+ start:817 stop:951 length:135 start_codon:yes stop_codon:yes gene_type:complete
MDKYEVSVTKVFGLAITNKTTVEAESIDDARDKAMARVLWMQRG